MYWIVDVVVDSFFLCRDNNSLLGNIRSSGISGVNNGASHGRERGSEHGMSRP